MRICSGMSVNFLSLSLTDLSSFLIRSSAYISVLLFSIYSPLSSALVNQTFRLQNFVKNSNWYFSEKISNIQDSCSSLSHYSSFRCGLVVKSAGLPPSTLDLAVFYDSVFVERTDFIKTFLNFTALTFCFCSKHCLNNSIPKPGLSFSSFSDTNSIASPYRSILLSVPSMHRSGHLSQFSPNIWLGTSLWFA